VTLGVGTPREREDVAGLATEVVEAEGVTDALVDGPGSRLGV
jgi:hypothetical protein